MCVESLLIECDVCGERYQPDSVNISKQLRALSSKSCGHCKLSNAATDWRFKTKKKLKKNLQKNTYAGASFK